MTDMGMLSLAVSAVRVAVRRSLVRHLEDHRPQRVLVACSGGADSLALAEAARFVAAKSGFDCGLVTVDHGLQEGSGQRATDIVTWADRAGYAPTLAVGVQATACPGGDGPEATARDARYAALVTAARQMDASAVLLGHTRDDQAETVLLALARGSGPRGLAGMPERRLLSGIVFLRPFLDVSRAVVREACLDSGLVPWDDPHNCDPSFARARVRKALPVLSEVLGLGLVPNLARTARIIASDVEYLDEVANRAAQEITFPGGGISVPGLAALPTAIRHRVLHSWGAHLGGSTLALSSRHIEALDALIVCWRGQGAVALPSGIRVERRAGQLVRM